MLDRCYLESSASYKHYGARGIRVCRRWRRFENFIADMGTRAEGMWLDRIDNDKGYHPSNCRWVAALKSNQNKRTVMQVKWKGRTYTVPEIAAKFGLKRHTLLERLQKGWPTASALKTKPLSPYQKGLLAAKARWGFTP